MSIVPELQLKPCPNCGGVGVHACPWRPIQPMSAEERQALNEALNSIFPGAVDETEQEGPVTGGPGSYT